MALRNFYMSYQSISSLFNEYFKTMTNLRDIIFHCEGVIGNNPFLVVKFLKAADPSDPDNPTENETAAAKTATEEAYMATTYLSGLKSARYGVLLNELHNAFRMGGNKYPKTLTDSYDLEINWRGGTKGTRVTPNGGVAFTTKSKEADLHATDVTYITQTGKPVI